MPLQKTSFSPSASSVFPATAAALPTRRRARPSSSRVLPPAMRLRCVSSRTAAGMPSASWTNCSPLRLTASRWTVLSPAPAAGAACGTWTTPPSCGPNRRASPTPSAASADWMCRCWMPFLSLRWTATATRYSSRWAATKTVRPASAFTPAAPTASSPAPIANYSPAS